MNRRVGSRDVSGRDTHRNVRVNLVHQKRPSALRDVAEILRGTHLLVSLRALRADHEHVVVRVQSHVHHVLGQPREVRRELVPFLRLDDVHVEVKVIRQTADAVAVRDRTGAERGTRPHVPPEQPWGEEAAGDSHLCVRCRRVRDRSVDAA